MVRGYFCTRGTVEYRTCVVFGFIMREAEIIAQGSVKGVLSGKHYSRAIRCQNVLYEAMERLRLEVF